MAKRNSTWQCSGTPDNPHDPFENFGPDCSVCGAKKEDILGSKTSDSQEKSSGGLKPLVPAIAAGATGLAVLLGGWFVSPNLPGVCAMLQNCQTWQADLAQARRSISGAQTTLDNKSAALADLENEKKQISNAIRTLNLLSQQKSMKGEVAKLLPDAQKIEKSLEERLLIARKPAKDGGKTSDDKKIDDKAKGTSPVIPGNPVESPVNPEPEPIPVAAEPVYEAPAPVYEAPAPVYEAPAPVYEAPAPVYEAPAPVYEAPAPVYEAPAKRDEPLIPE
jgi:hypothetical protein